MTQNARKRDLKSQVRSGVIGHAIGDALGVPVEFKSRLELIFDPVQSMRSSGTHGMPAGTWSDDTSMTIALMQSLIDCGRFDYQDIMDKFYQWWKKDEFTATGMAFDIGGTCARAITNYGRGVELWSCGENRRASNGNGSLMRILPVALYCFAKEVKGNARYELVKKVSSLTHAHEISVLGCLIYVNLACFLLEGSAPAVAYRKAQKEDYARFTAESRKVYCRMLESNICDYPEDKISSSGYVVSSLEAALWCLLKTNNYQDAVLKAVNLGDDADTVGAITGSLAGITYGYDAIPQEWTTQLQRADYLLELCDKFADAINQSID